MNAVTRIQTPRQHTATRFLAGVLLILILAWTSALNTASSFAADSSTNQSRILLAANDAHTADAAMENATKEKATSAKLPPESGFWAVNILRSHPELAIFLTLALGYWAGAIKIGNFSLGAVTGTLLAGILVGQLQIEISGPLKSMFFLFFLFSVGYSVGPQFVRGVAKSGAPQLIFGAIVCLLCLLFTWLAAIIQGYDVGYAAGLLAGAQTISASIGLATDAINKLGLPADKANEILSHIPVGYAVSYIWGTVGCGLILAKVGPIVLGVNMAEECKKMETKMSAGTPEDGIHTAWHQLSMRAYKVAQGGRVVGKTIAEVEAIPTDERLFIEGVRRDGQIIEFDPSTTLRGGDVLAVSGHTESLIALEKVATEVADRELLSIPVESVDVVVAKKVYEGATIIELAKKDLVRGVYLNKITRGSTSVDIPILAQTEIHRGDILKLSGTRAHIDRIVAAIGYADRPVEATDVVWMGLAVVIGGLIGAVSIPVGGIPITLSTSGGALIGGLILGWGRAVYPTFGRVPGAAQWFMQSIGLNVFIAVIGISTGPGFVAGVFNQGLSLFLWGLFATSVPMILGMLIGKYFFKFPAPINLGCCGGARTSTASVGMVGEAAGGSNIPMRGYTVPYAVGNTLLTLWGMVIVLMLGVPG